MTETPEEALARIQNGFSKNDMAVVYAFYDRGVDPEAINPRQNVLTFHAWKAKGRRVARGAISVRVTTWVPCNGRKSSETPAEGEEKKENGAKLRPKTAFLFHESQTLPKDAGKDDRPAAWSNPELVKVGTYEPQEITSDDASASPSPCRALVPA